MTEYTQEMRAAGQTCPICGFWHTSMSCPPQVATMALRIKMLKAERDRMREAITLQRDEIWAFYEVAINSGKNKSVIFSSVLRKWIKKLNAALSQESTDESEPTDD